MGGPPRAATSSEWQTLLRYRREVRAPLSECIVAPATFYFAMAKCVLTGTLL
jgi:hypothetical protein